MTLNQYLGLRPGVRSRCPFCDARRGLAIWDRWLSALYDDGSGVFKCFACDRAGSGVSFLVKTSSMTRAEASRALGLAPTMALLDLDRERQRAAWARLEHRRQNTTMQACRDLVFLRNHMNRIERQDWRIHDTLPHRLRQSEQARRQAERAAGYLKEVQTETT